jgi:hypothetical protein
MDTSDKVFFSIVATLLLTLFVAVVLTIVISSPLDSAEEIACIEKSTTPLSLHLCTGHR